MPWEPSNAGPCECEWFENTAAEPGSSIDFDDEVKEYQLTYQGPQGPVIMVLRYCPFCGGKAPASRREEMFTRLTDAELHRLDKLTSDLRTIDQVRDRLGEPGEDIPKGDGETRPARGEEPPVFEQYRTLVYDGLSETVQVRVTERHDGSVRFSFSGKWLGKEPAGGESEADS